MGCLYEDRVHPAAEHPHDQTGSIKVLLRLPDSLLMKLSEAVPAQVPTQATVSALPVARTWPGFLRFSMTDLFFLTILFWLFMADPAGWDRLLWDGDTAMHTRTGDFILDTGHVPTADPFSFTKPGGRWFAFQWLTGVLFAQLNRTFGLKGIVLLCGVVIALYLTVLARDMLLRGVNGLMALLLVMVGSSASMLHFHARPHLFTLLFLTIGSFLIARDREHQSWRIWLLVPLMALWVNMHSGFPALLAVLGMLVAGCVLHRDWDKTKRYGAVLAACAAATLVNPNGIALHQHIAKFLNSSWAMANINEYQSPVFRGEDMYYYMGLLFLALIACGRHFVRREWTECMWILFFAAGSLTSARHIPLFIVMTLPLTGLALTEAWTQFSTGKPRSSMAGVLRDISDKTTGNLQQISIWTAAIVVGVALFTSSKNWPKDLSTKYFPVAVAREYAGELASNRVFTTDQWGDYLLWTGYPKQRVFIDGRSDFFGDEIGGDYLTILEGRTGWREAMERYKVNMVLVPPDTPLLQLISYNPNWRVIHRDSQAVLLTLQP